MTHIPPLQPPPTAAERIAGDIIAAFNTEIDRRFAIQRSQYRAFWDSEIPPDDILAAWGARAQTMLAAAAENVEHLGKLAEFLGKPLDDMLPQSFVVPRRAFVTHEDGTVTLAPPAAGHDAWGRPIPRYKPDPEPEAE